MQFTAVDGSPVPNPALPVVRAIKRRRPDLTLTSCYRGDDPGASRILKTFHKSTQAFLYWAYQQRLRGVPGFGWANPANRPRFSTHECFNDGVAFPRIPAGSPIPAQFVGQDWSNGAAAAQAAREEGYLCTLTYPTSARERQHINCRKGFRIHKATFRALKQGSHGPRVKDLKRRLHFLGYFRGKDMSGGFGPTLAGALTAFQKDHALKPDGVYGIHTHHQLLASVAWHKKKHSK